MKKIFYTLIILLVSNFVLAHDLKIAFFEIKEKDGSMSAVLRADRVEMLKALNSDLSLESISNYISEHIKISTDQEVEIEATSYELRDQIMEVKLKVVGLPLEPNEVTVWNTLLLDQIDGHENVVIFKLHDKTRSFRMSAKRKEIIAKYENI